MRWPGLDTRFSPLITHCPCSSYFSRNFRALNFEAGSSTASALDSQPFFSRSFAKLNFRFEYGKTTSCFLAGSAFLICVSMSDNGSVEFILLPTRLNNTRDLGFGSHFSKTNAAQIKVSHISALSATAPAAAYHARGEFRLPL